MRTTRMILAVMLALVSPAVMAQTTTLRGVLMDETLGEGEPFATVRVFRAGKSDKPVAMFLTGADGTFSHDVRGRGQHDVVFSSVGKDDLRRRVELPGEGVLSLDTLYMKDNATMLGGVEVVAQKPLVKMETDKMSYNVSEDEDAKASTVLDMLRKVPMVTVDGQDNITVAGSSSFRVYVDGKPSVMFQSNPSMVFKSMPATAVKSIEVVTNPGAKYDAEGAGGVLNIVMNRQDAQAMQSLNGYNGSVRLSAGNRGVGGGVFVSGQQDKLSYSANVMENYQTPGATDVEMEQKNGDGVILSTASTKVKLPFTMANLSVGYDLDAMSSLNATLSVNSFSMRNNGTTTTRQTGGLYGQGFDYTTSMRMKNSRTSLSGNVDYQRFFNKERTQSLVLTYQLAYSPQKNEQHNDFQPTEAAAIDLTDRSSLNTEHTTDHTLQADYTQPLRPGQTLSVGTKLTTRRATSDADYFLAGTLDAAAGMDYTYKSTILAGYAEYGGQWKLLGAKAGLRYEHTWQDVEYRQGMGTDFSTHYGSLVPSATLTLTLAQGSNIGLAYNMRISRPGITYLNPYVNRADPNSLSYGNTNLDVEKTHNIALVYNMYTPKLMMNLNLHHNFTDNAIEQYSFFNGELLCTTYGNIVSRHQTGLNAYVNWLAAPKTRLMLNGGASYTDMRSTVLQASSSGWQANAMVGLQQTLPWDLKLGAFAITSTKSYTLQGWSGGFNLLTANLTKTLLNDRLSISLQGLTGLSSGGNLKMETFSQGSNFMSHQDIKVPIGGVTLSVSYTFGNSRQQQRQHSSRVKSDYIEQQSQGEMLNSVGSGMPQ